MWEIVLYKMYLIIITITYFCIIYKNGKNKTCVYIWRICKFIYKTSFIPDWWRLKSTLQLYFISDCGPAAPSIGPEYAFPGAPAPTVCVSYSYFIGVVGCAVAPKGEPRKVVAQWKFPVPQIIRECAYMIFPPTTYKCFVPGNIVWRTSDASSGRPAVRYVPFDISGIRHSSRRPSSYNRMVPDICCNEIKRSPINIALTCIMQQNSIHL